MRSFIPSVIKCNFSENEKWVLEQEKHLIECIRRNKHNGPLTNLTECGERELSGSKYDYFVIYDLEQHKEIKRTGFCRKVKILIKNKIYFLQKR